MRVFTVLPYSSNLCRTYGALLTLEGGGGGEGAGERVLSHFEKQS